MKTQILSVDIAVPENSFTQNEVINILNVNSPKALRFFSHSHIKKRHLLFSNSTTQKNFVCESNSDLRNKFITHSLKLITTALKKALKNIQLSMDTIEYICCVTSTGFLVPGLSALLIEELNLKQSCQRLDVVGMGCNAGLNGLNAVKNWCQSNPNKIAVLICAELCSCIYDLDNSENNALVNSLFGDGVAVAILNHTASPNGIAHIIDFQSHMIKNSLQHLKFNWNDKESRNSFFINKETPLLLSQNIEIPLEILFERNKTNKKKIKNWIVHSGGSAILDSIENKLELSNESFNDTRWILENYGNVSSSSFLFTFKRIIELNKNHKNDLATMITMGPGLTIETALIQWN